MNLSGLLSLATAVCFTLRPRSNYGNLCRRTAQGSSTFSELSWTLTLSRPLLSNHSDVVYILFAIMPQKSKLTSPLNIPLSLSGALRVESNL